VDIVASSEDTEDITVSLHLAAFGASLAEEVTVEFAPGLRRRVMLGTPPPPPPTDLYAVRLGLIGNRPRRNLLTPLVTVLLVVTAVAVGLNLRVRPEPAGAAASAPATGPSRPAVPVAATTAAPPPDATQPDSTRPDTAPRSATPDLSGTTTVAFGQNVALRAAGFPCGAGAHLTVTIAGYYVATADTDAQGGAAVLVRVERVSGRAGQVALSGTSDYLTLAPGNWIVRAAAPAQSACTAEASATTTVTVKPPQ
jgi:hypothetical protein